MRIFKTKWFLRYAKQERITDGSLCDAIGRAEQGLVEANLGGGVIKQRVARAGQGKSGGYRLLIAYASGNRAVFMYGFAKNERDNIEDNELTTLKEIASGWLAANAGQLERAMKDGLLQEVTYDEDSKKT